LFDTFEGIPMKAEIDKHLVGDFADTNYEQVKNHFKTSNNVTVTKGLFPSSAKNVISNFDKFCFVHIDADQYESTLNSLRFFYDKMVVGGFIVLDDWGWLPGVDAAINEFFADKPEKPIQAASMQCFIIKG
jgi:O-methyltransferase